MFKFRSWVQAGVVALCCWGGAASALQVQFTAVDVVDTTPGSDAWRYDYVASGAFAEFQGFTLIYDRAAYAGLSLTAPPAASAFDPTLAQPDMGLGVDGLLSLTAQRSIGAGESFAFSVGFVHLGVGKPGSQPFELFADDFSITGGGITSAVPEPATTALMLVGLMALGLRARRH
ncbi:MAG: PEP-CTERM sorting domain-containing protein [Microbacteriaceae bacterium]|nr:PEP-CTERM sorting domain-containing protein [Burkholderiaceae bacterium]